MCINASKLRLYKLNKCTCKLRRGLCCTEKHKQTQEAKNEEHTWRLSCPALQFYQRFQLGSHLRLALRDQLVNGVQVALHVEIHVRLFVVLTFSDCVAHYAVHLFSAAHLANRAAAGVALTREARVPRVAALEADARGVGFAGVCALLVLDWRVLESARKGKALLRGVAEADHFAVVSASDASARQASRPQVIAQLERLLEHQNGEVEDGEMLNLSSHFDGLVPVVDANLARFVDSLAELAIGAPLKSEHL